MTTIIKAYNPTNVSTFKNAEKLFFVPDETVRFSDTTVQVYNGQKCNRYKDVTNVTIKDTNVMFVNPIADVKYFVHDCQLVTIEKV